MRKQRTSQHGGGTARRSRGSTDIVFYRYRHSMKSSVGSRGVRCFEDVSERVDVGIEVFSGDGV